MKSRTSVPARIFAATALAVAFVIAIVAIGGALGGGDSNGSHGHRNGGKAVRHSERTRHDVPATYVVQSGDTLVSIAHRTGVTVAQIEALNPEIDPQILIAGEKLKLR